MLAVGCACAAVALSGCAKHSDTTETTTTTSGATAAASGADTTGGSPAAKGGAAATAAPTEPPGGTATSSSGAAIVSAPPTSSAAAPAADATGAPFTFITLPVYPGATEDKSQALSLSANGTSGQITIYTTKDDGKTVSEWYKTHLPANWKNAIMTTNDKTLGTFSNEGSEGDQSVIVNDAQGGVTRIQLATKHGK
jgi:hypothetical protein